MDNDKLIDFIKNCDSYCKEHNVIRKSECSTCCDEAVAALQAERKAAKMWINEMEDMVSNNLESYNKMLEERDRQITELTDLCRELAGEYEGGLGTELEKISGELEKEEKRISELEEQITYLKRCLRAYTMDEDTEIKCAHQWEVSPEGWECCRCGKRKPPLVG